MVAALEGTHTVPLALNDPLPPFDLLPVLCCVSVMSPRLWRNDSMRKFHSLLATSWVTGNDSLKNR